MPTVSYGIAATADDTTVIAGSGGGTDPTVLIAGDPTAIAGVGPDYVGVRFVGLAVPQGATISSATLTLKRQDAAPALGASSSGSAWGVIKGANVDDCAAWTTTSPQAVAKTTAAANITNGATVAYNVAAIVQAITDRAGWTSGNALGFATDPAGANGYIEWIDRQASSADCAQLSITYTAGGGASYSISGSVSGSAVATGAILARRSVRGTVSAGATAAGAIRANRPVGGISAGVAISTAAVRASRPIGAVATATGVAAGLAGRSAPIQAAATGSGISAGAMGAIGADKPLDSTASASATATGAIQASRSITGPAVATATATGLLGAQRSLTGQATVTATAAGEIGTTGAPEEAAAESPLFNRRRRRAVR